MPIDPSSLGQIGENVTGPLSKAPERALTLADLVNKQQLSQIGLADAKKEQADMAAFQAATKGDDWSTEEGQAKILEKAYKQNPTLGLKLNREFTAQQQSATALNVEKLKLWEEHQQILSGALEPIEMEKQAFLQKNPGATPKELDAHLLPLANRAIGVLKTAQTRDGKPILDPNMMERAQALLDPNAPPGTLSNGITQVLGQTREGMQTIVKLQDHFRGVKKDALDERVAERSMEHMGITEAQGAERLRQGDPSHAQIDEDTLDRAASEVMVDPARIRDYAGGYGRGAQAIRGQINQRITERLKEAGMKPADLIQLRANAKAESGSIQKLVGQQNAITAFEKLAKFNGQRVLELLDKVDATGVPMIEGVRRAGTAKLGGVDAAEFASVLTTFQQEAARILANPNMTGVVTDSLRAEVMKMTPDSMSTDQGKRVINRLFTEMDVRKSAIDDQIKTSEASLAPPGSGGPGRAPSGPPASPAGGGAPVKVSTPEEAAKLPRGTPILLPDGTQGWAQ